MQPHIASLHLIYHRIQIKNLVKVGWLVRYATLLEARDRALTRHPSVLMYVTGDEVVNDRIFAYYLVYCKDHFKENNFIDLVDKAISRTREEAPSACGSSMLILLWQHFMCADDPTLDAS